MNPVITVAGSEELLAKLRRLARAGEGRSVRKALYAGGLVIEGRAKVNIQARNLVDTGFLLNSVYTATRDEGDYGQAGTAAGEGQEMLPRAQPGPEEAIVAVGADYGIYHEMGTRKMAPRPFMRPAADEGGPEAVEAIAAVLRDEISG